MTTTAKLATREELVDRIENLTAELAQARADVALLERLKNAEANATRCARELDAAQTALADAIADEVSAQRRATFSTIESIEIRDVAPEETVLRSAFSIRVTRKCFDSMAGTNVSKMSSFDGFGVLPPEVMEYLVREKPEVIPAKIAALVPGDPEGAFEAYFTGRRRGYLAGATA